MISTSSAALNENLNPILLLVEMRDAKEPGNVVEDLHGTNAVLRVFASSFLLFVIEYIVVYLVSFPFGYCIIVS